jgi:hypothetical protein
MNRHSRLFGSALIGLAGVAAVAIADNPSGPALSRGGPRGHHIRHFERCLSTVGLSADQQSSIQGIQSESKATLQADFAAMKAAREKLHADLASGSDKSVLGQDVLDQDAAAAKMKSDARATHDQIVAKLNPDQQNALATCMQQRRGTGEATPDEQR